MLIPQEVRRCKIAWAGTLLLTSCTTGQFDRAIERRVEHDRDRASVSESPVVEVGLERESFDLEAPLKLDDASVLELAQRYSRSLQDRRDELVRAGLTLFGVERDFGPRLSGTAGYVFSSIDGDETETAEASIDLAQKLPTGGEVQLGGNWNEVQAGGEGDGGAETLARIRVDQPLTRNAGYRAGWESFTQARRDFLYALRAFDLDRQDAAIAVMRQYYNLVQQRSVVANTRQNLRQFEFLRKRSEALFKVDRAPAIDVLRSQQQELTALNRLNEVEERYTIGLGRFLVALGLPAELEVELGEESLGVREVPLDEADAIELALANRLDLRTARDRVEDAERQLANARQNRLPDLKVYGEGALRDDGNGESTEEISGGVTLDLPLDLRAERDAVKEAALALESARRTWEQRRDEVRLDVREAFSRLRTQRIAVDIQWKNIEIAEKRTRNAMLQFRNGTLSNRDVIEAENELLGARNAWGQALVDYEIQRLELLRNVGLMAVAADGRMVELTPPGGDGERVNGGDEDEG